MTNLIPRIIAALASLCSATLLCVLQVVALAPPAQALTGIGHGPGYLSATGWWLGTYRLDDGAQGFCLNAGKPSPTGHPLDYADGSALGWFTPEQSARLAYLSRSWAGTGDRLTAGAGQIATWLVAGMGGHSAEQFAARAGADADAVLARAHAMAEESASLASTDFRADAIVELAETGPGRVRVELTVDRLSGPETLPPGAHTARVALDGATFLSGGATADIPTGTDIPIVPSGSSASVAIGMSAMLEALPYGDRLTVAVPRDDAQAVLIAVPATASASANASAVGPSPLPFQPIVSTVTSSATAAPGAAIRDRLTIGVAAGAGLLPGWGVWMSEDGFAPITATVESTLHGPFAEPIAPGPSAPEDAPAVCTVETVVTGTGEYETPACELPAAGYYVWTERIDAARTPAAEGGARLLPWQSKFGVASEVTFAPAPPIVAAPERPATLAATGGRVATADPAIALGLLATGLGALAVASVVRHRRTRGRS
ncbi:hypothetical protein ATY41_00430 [Leifsonia xyli subsp. xyli]|uniref:Prealbumin-like fold domain-containing protein n=1 Tax=Leifsonia xyli subsp. xyli TaxID=59736 RepID=A0A1E2SN54_LEIXY|nr:hypothetical protein [Leifsonia xyli]ODA91207.1 hypothetical protein ATY41_00430 [Leifsonia xyli subsp. xyli]